MFTATEIQASSNRKKSMAIAADNTIISTPDVSPDSDRASGGTMASSAKHFVASSHKGVGWIRKACVNEGRINVEIASKVAELMIAELATFRAQFGLPLHMRVSVHCGDVVSGIVGSTRPRFCEALCPFVFNISLLMISPLTIRTQVY